MALTSLWVVPRRILGLHDQDALSFVNATQDCIEAMSLPRHEAGAQLQVIEKTHRPKLGRLARTLLPALIRIYQLELRVVAHSLCARSALTVEEYRHVNGRLPESLDVLVPTFMASVPLDPFDGQPLRFHHLNPGYVVYSVGMDLADDHGEERRTGKERGDQTTYDEAFIVSR